MTSKEYLTIKEYLFSTRLQDAAVERILLQNCRILRRDITTELKDTTKGYYYRIEGYYERILLLN